MGQSLGLVRLIEINIEHHNINIAILSLAVSTDLINQDKYIFTKYVNHYLLGNIPYILFSKMKIRPTKLPGR